TMPATSPMYVGETYTPTVVERTGPFGFLRWQETVLAPTPAMSAPVMTTPAVMPAGATTTPATTSDGVIAGSYVVPSTSTTTVMPAAYTYTTPFGQYYSTPMYMNGTTYYSTPGTVMP